MLAEDRLGGFVAGEVSRLAGVGGEIEELFGACAAVEDDVLVPGVAEHAAFARVVAIEQFGHGEFAWQGASFDGWAQAGPAGGGGRRDAGVITEGGEDVG